MCCETSEETGRNGQYRPEGRQRNLVVLGGPGSPLEVNDHTCMEVPVFISMIFSRTFSDRAQISKKKMSEMIHAFSF